MDFILSPKTSTIPDDEISMDTLTSIWNGIIKLPLTKQINGHQTETFYEQITQDNFLTYVYSNIIYLHTTVVPKLVNSWDDEKLVGFYNEDDLDEIADNFTKEFIALIGDKPYKIKKHVVLTRALEDRYIELLTLFPSKELIAKFNYRVQENRVDDILQKQVRFDPTVSFDYRMGSTVSAYESHLKFMTMFDPKLKDYLELYQPDYPEAIDYLNFIIETKAHFLDAALQFYFATAVLNYDEIHYIFDLSSDQINHSMMFSNKRIGEVEEIKFKSDLSPTFIFNLALDLRRLTFILSELESISASKELFKRQLDKVLSYFHGDRRLMNAYIYRNDGIHTIPYTPIK
jgi:hypothetical protein